MADCRYEICGHEAHARGLCKGHYMQWWRGEPRPGPLPGQPGDPNLAVFMRIPRRIAETYCLGCGVGQSDHHRGMWSCPKWRPSDEPESDD
jgi:hypothetical protein